MVAAWASVLGDSFDCSSCNRPKSFLCPKRDHIDDDDLMQRISDSPMPSSVPMIFKAENANICPRFLLKPFGGFIAKAYSWWEKGQLGLTMMNAPSWVDEAFRILESQRQKAMKFKRKKPGGK